ncbi:hypothetical protein [Pseudodesulfovibrio sp.]|uniref:hypothetical protein n=1 Tax=Pseudodesulfovibrio sp. TaxID=2035812 RepID=UPI00260A8212|nr:hypothetical protein [Pseudodesulfovibrio sp.]MDD3311479.1 hypothetical protein [Pseudodesulfovibrio sp.]
MRNVLILSLVLALALLRTLPAAAAEDADKFRQIKILDDVMVFVDLDGGGLKAEEVRGYAIDSFVKHMRGMLVNNDAVVDNYPAEGLKLENVGYIIMKVMDIRTKAGLNVYHLNFEFGIPPRSVYWDTATMGVAPTTHDLKKEVLEDVDEVMRKFSDDFYRIRGE